MPVSIFAKPWPHLLLIIGPEKTFEMQDILIKYSVGSRKLCKGIWDTLLDDGILIRLTNSLEENTKHVCIFLIFLFLKVFGIWDTGSFLTRKSGSLSFARLRRSAQGITCGQRPMITSNSQFHCVEEFQLFKFLLTGRIDNAVLPGVW